MAIAITQAHLDRERDLLIDTLRRLLTPLSNGARFNWLYNNSPHGAARGWLVIDRGRDAIVGMAAAFPRRFYVGGSEVFTWALGDFCLEPQYRSLGPALQLQRACLRVVEQDPSAFCYDFPGGSMVAVYKRLGFSVIGKLLRVAKPLRVDRKVKEMIKNPTAQRVVSFAGNAFLKIGLPKGTADGTLEMTIQDGPCGEEFTALMHEQRGKFEICLQRSAEYLNWRYVNNPLAQYEIVTARRNGRLVGYAVWTQTNEDASIADLFGEQDSAMVRGLVAAITALAEKRGLMTLSISVNESHPWRSLFSKMGFRLRESIPVVIIPSKTFAGKINPQLTGWYLMQGDRDS